MKKSYKQITVLIGIILTIGAYFYFDLHKILTLAALQQNIQHIKQLVNQHYSFALLVSIALYASVVGLSLPGAATLSITNGALFGLAHGMIVNLLGATLGSIGAFIMIRYFLYTSMQQLYKRKLQSIHTFLQNYGTISLLSLRLVPIFPLFMVNIAAALSPISLLTYTWTTALGILPGCFIFTYAGQELATLTSINDILNWNILLASVLLALLLLVTYMIRSRIKH